ncbi:MULTISPECIES: DUF4381 domain-containing protein [Ensifer]|nr:MULTISPECIES: DUF4381 domain-containing protein [Ensifer]KQX43358.1 hypothetical protein ASD49_12000 [Ensifer sp. Root1298]KQX72909.1 hypothetical protein ASD41_12500 [Ensifer sp. Root1312]KSV78824.1 hypothetical protein N185_13005 [Sinorhizobium sp. GW3]MBD9540682.1 DUF4381 domain-containing protein [Ensifer sp. ENS04]KQX16058.1 hypothetical protein ASD01_05680 [Ensifer sp. Root423]
MATAAPAKDPILDAALRQLADIALPQPVSMMPQTPAWVVLGCIVLLMAAFACWRWYRRWEANSYRREALADLRKIEAGLTATGSRGEALAALPVLLKRTALSVWPREAIAGLHGTGWTKYLDAHSGGPVFPIASARFFEEAEYRGSQALAAVPEAEAKAYIAAARHWIEAHHVRA